MTTDQCNAAGCEQPVLVHFTGGPRDGQRWCWTHAPNDALVTRGVSRYEAFGRAAEPMLRRAQDELRGYEAAGSDCVAANVYRDEVDAALALLEAPHS